jgi:hypothetical protein
MMEATAVAILLNIGMSLFLIVGYTLLIIPITRETVEKDDWLNGLRLRLLLALFFTVITFIPSLAYQMLRLFGVDSPEVRNIVTVTSKLNDLLMFYLFWGIIRYKTPFIDGIMKKIFGKRDDEEK